MWDCLVGLLRRTVAKVLGHDDVALSFLSKMLIAPLVRRASKYETSHSFLPPLVLCVGWVREPADFSVVSVLSGLLFWLELLGDLRVRASVPCCRAQPVHAHVPQLLLKSRHLQREERGVLELPLIITYHDPPPFCE